MVFRPVGDLPPSVYWVRRLVLLVVVLAVVALVWWLWPNGDDATSPTASEPSVTPTPTVSSSTPEPTATKTKTNKATSSQPPCQDSAIEVTVETDSESYGPEQQPSITFTVENVSNDTCVRDIGQAANELQITSGGTQVWSSDDCNPGGEEDLDTLKPGDRFVQTVTWPRVQSSEGCPTPQEEAPSGSYQVLARNGDVLSEPTVFTLE